MNAADWSAFAARHMSVYVCMYRHYVLCCTAEPNIHTHKHSYHTLLWTHAVVGHHNNIHTRTHHENHQHPYTHTFQLRMSLSLPLRVCVWICISICIAANRKPVQQHLAMSKAYFTLAYSLQATVKIVGFDVCLICVLFFMYFCAKRISSFYLRKKNIPKFVLTILIVCLV